MFLRSIGSRFSIHQRALLLRRVAVRTVINAQQTVVEENGCDTSLVRVGLCLTFALQLPMNRQKVQQHASLLVNFAPSWVHMLHGRRESKRKCCKRNRGSGELAAKLPFPEANFTIYSEFDGNTSGSYYHRILCKNVNRLLLQILGEHGQVLLRERSSPRNATFVEEG